MNRSHVPTLRGLVIAHSDLGDLDTARKYLALLMKAAPGLTVERYLSTSPGGLPLRQRLAEAMARAGLPRN